MAANFGGAALGVWSGIPKQKFTFGPFYASLEAGYGFDASVMNYGDLKCSNTDEVVGLDGWYCRAQAYAHISGAIGISVDLAIISGDFEILGVDAGAAVKAQLPNLTWLGGVIHTRIGPDELFTDNRPGFTSSYLAKFQPLNNKDSMKVLETPVTYSNGGIRFPIPQLDNSTTYKLMIVRRDEKTQNNTTSNLVSGSGGLDKSFGIGQQLAACTVAITQNKLLANLVTGGDKKLCELNFRTSAYNRLVDKVNAGTFKPSTSEVKGTAVLVFTNFAMPHRSNSTSPSATPTRARCSRTACTTSRTSTPVPSSSSVPTSRRVPGTRVSPSPSSISLSRK